MIRTIFFIACIIYAAISFGDREKLPLPRFASIKSGEVNARTEPSIKAKVEWVFVKKGEPVEITAEYEQWRQIRDIKGEGGWVHSSVLSGKRFVVINSESKVEMLKSPDKNAPIIAKLSPFLRCNFNKCKDDWCNISCKSVEGWVARKYLWGVYKEG